MNPRIRREVHTSTEQPNLNAKVNRAYHRGDEPWSEKFKRAKSCRVEE
jgi:hypothetical protein